MIGRPPLPPGVAALRFVCQAAGFALACLLGCTGIVVGNLVTLGRAGDRVNLPLIRFFGRSVLWASGVRLVLEPAVAAEFSRPRRRIISLNHTSTLDMFVMTAFWAPSQAAIIKREFIFMPVLGWAALALRFVLVDRGNRERAMASMARAAERVRRENLGITIAPEGTRSKSGELGAFKLGAFHLAAAAEAPIVPLVLHGPRDLWPRTERMCRPGVVTVRLLPEITPLSPDAGHDAFHAQAAALRARYAEEIARMEATIAV